MSKVLGVDHWNVELDGELNELNIEKKLKNKYNFKFHQCRFKSGFELGYHKHSWDKADTVLSGQLEMVVLNADNNQEQQFVLKPGDILYLPANTIHKAKVVGNQDCVFYDTH